jgi:hypothetical protein
MDKKERKRDIAVFSNMLKDLMNEPLENPMTTLDRDLQHFMYGRVATLIKHNENQPIGSLNDIGAVAGAALADVCKEFVRNKVEDDKVEEIFGKIKDSMAQGFDLRSPVIEKSQEEKVES